MSNHPRNKHFELNVLSISYAARAIKSGELRMFSKMIKLASLSVLLSCGGCVVDPGYYGDAPSPYVAPCALRLLWRPSLSMGRWR
jgi:hypothetical protein